MPQNEGLGLFGGEYPHQTNPFLYSVVRDPPNEIALEHSLVLTMTTC